MTTETGQPNELESPSTSDGNALREEASVTVVAATTEAIESPTSVPATQLAVGNANPRTPKEVSVTIPGLSQTLHGIDHELQLLSRIYKYDWVSKRLLVLRNVIIASLLVLVTILIVVVAVRELTKNALVINGFDVPTSLEARGFTSRVLGKKLADQMTFVRSQVLTRLSTREIVPSVWKTDADLAIADSKLTVGAVFAYVRGLFGRDTNVDGELTEQGQEVALTVRIRGKPHKSITGKVDDLDSLMLKAAEYIMLDSHPYIVGQFRYYNKDQQGALQAAMVAARSDNPEEVAEALTLWGKILRNKGDHAGAIAKWEESLLTSPNTSKAWNEITLRWVVEGRKDDVLKRIEKRTQSFPKDSEAWARLAELRYLEGDMAGAGKLNQKALTLDPESAPAQMLEVDMLTSKGDMAGALKIGEKMARAVVKTQDPLLRSLAVRAQVDALLGLRDYARARSIADGMIAIDPLSLRGHYALAQVLYATHDYEGAIASATKAISFGSIGAYFTRVSALIGKGDLDAAEREAIENLKRNRPVGLSEQGLIRLIRLRPAEAAEKYRERIRERPMSWYGYNGLARALAALGNHAEAEAQFRKAIDLAPKFSAPHFHWGEMLATKGDHAGAIKRYEDALKLDPRWGQPYAKWGESLVALGNAEAAKEKFAKALELEPKHPDFQRYKAKL